MTFMINNEICTRELPNDCRTFKSYFINLFLISKYKTIFNHNLKITHKSR